MGDTASFPRSKERGFIEALRRPADQTSDAGAFRVQKNAASLKPLSVVVWCPTRRPFPRSKERGFIEAMHQFGDCPLPTNFPRSKERGFIEAMQDLITCERHYNFPRSKERGFIEACDS